MVPLTFTGSPIFVTPREQYHCWMHAGHLSLVAVMVVTHALRAQNRQTALAEAERDAARWSLAREAADTPPRCAKAIAEADAQSLAALTGCGTLRIEARFGELLEEAAAAKKPPCEQLPLLGAATRAAKGDGRVKARTAARVLPIVASCVRTTHAALNAGKQVTPAIEAAAQALRAHFPDEAGPLKLLVATMLADMVARGDVAGARTLAGRLGVHEVLINPNARPFVIIATIAKTHAATHDERRVAELILTQKPPPPPVSAPPIQAEPCARAERERAR